jgi:hypothetical protein
LTALSDPPVSPPDLSGSRSLAVRLGLLLVGALTLALVYALVVRFAAPQMGLDLSPEPRPSSADIVQVEVLNGAGVSGLARQATEYLRSQGFDVVDVGNAAPTTTSHVLDRVGDPQSALRVAQALGLDDGAVRPDSGAYFLDCTVVIGQDYQRLRPFAAD